MTKGIKSVKASKRPLRKPTKADVAALESDYAALRPVATRFVDELEHQLNELLTREEIALSFPIQKRIKEWSSITEKIERRQLSLSSIRDLTDFVGFRIVLQFRRDVERVCQLLADTLDVVDRYDTGDRLREDQFGYSSIHFIVRLPDAWLAVPTMAGMKGMVAEIQVRTTAQHIWAAASHTLQYKNEESVPPVLRRSIHRVSALLETVDLEFERVLADRAAYKEAGARSPQPNEPLNVDVLEQVLDVTWPIANKAVGREDYSSLLQDLFAFNVLTRGDLEQLLAARKDAVLEREAQQVASQSAKLAKGEKVQSPQRLQQGVFFLHAGLTRTALSQAFGAKWHEYQTKKRQVTRRV